MPIFQALIKVRLDEDTPEKAMRVAQELAQKINDDCYTDAAKVVAVTRGVRGPAAGSLRGNFDTDDELVNWI